MADKEQHRVIPVIDDFLPRTLVTSTSFVMGKRKKRRTLSPPESSEEEQYFVGKFSLLVRLSLCIIEPPRGHHRRSED